MKKIILMLNALLMSATLAAGNVTEEEALRKAQQLMPGKRFAVPSASRSTAKDGSTTANFYVFNADDEQGFAIVSGDDRTEPILGYADAGSLDMGHLPDNMQAWLDGYAQQISAIADGAATRATVAVQGEAVAPLVTCHWGQNDPFNLQRPLRADDEGKMKNCLTG